MPPHVDASKRHDAAAAGVPQIIHVQLPIRELLVDLGHPSLSPLWTAKGVEVNRR